MSYKVFVDDNFHYQDEDERYFLGEFETLDAAISACRKIVDESLTGSFEPGMTADALFGTYTSFGDDPFIVGITPPAFSAWEYARQRSAEICDPRIP